VQDPRSNVSALTSYCFTFFFMKILSVPGTGYSAIIPSELGTRAADALLFCLTKDPNKLALDEAGCA